MNVSFALRIRIMVLWGLVQTITAGDIYAALRKTKLGAAGLRDVIRKLDLRALLEHFNLWVYVGHQSADIRRSRIVLIPKVPNRPCLDRSRSILMTDRLSGLLEFNSRQRDFIKGDGIADNVFSSGAEGQM